MPFLVAMIVVLAIPLMAAEIALYSVANHALTDHLTA
jgi:hypothetical protein